MLNIPKQHLTVGTTSVVAMKTGLLLSTKMQLLAKRILWREFQLKYASCLTICLMEALALVFPQSSGSSVGSAWESLLSSWGCSDSISTKNSNKANLSKNLQMAINNNMDVKLMNKMEMQGT